MTLKSGTLFNMKEKVKQSGYSRGLINDVLFMLEVDPSRRVDTITLYKNLRAVDVERHFPRIYHDQSVLERELRDACKNDKADIIDRIASYDHAIDWNYGLYDAKDITVVKKLVECGANDFNLGVEMACKIGTQECLLFMIEQGATIDAWEDLLTLACRRKEPRKAMIQYLLDRGAKNVNDAMVNICMQESIHFGIVQLLLERGASVNDGLSAVCKYGSGCRQGSITKMIELGATNVKEVFEDAIRYHRFDVAEYLVRTHFNISAEEKSKILLKLQALYDDEEC
jgi:hypothetical protein